MREMKRKQLQAKFRYLEAAYRSDPAAWEDWPIEDMKGTYEAEILGVTLPLVHLKDFLNDEYGWPVDRHVALRNEITEDILPIVQPGNDSDVAWALQKVVDKINSMELYSSWQVAGGPAQRISPELEKLYEGEELEDDDRHLAPKGPVLRLGGSKYIVHNQYDFDLDAPATEQKDFYTIIIRTLTDGTFHKLKRCKECPRFFIADRLTDRFCRPECSQAFFSRDAANRVRKSRARQAANRKKRRRSRTA